MLDAVDAVERAWQVIREELDAIMRPPPTLTVSQWADLHRFLPATSAEPGRWNTDRVPYMREIMDACSDPMVERVVVMKAAQVGYSEVLLNVLGYFIDQDPAPILLVQISTGEAEKFSKERITPMIESCPVLLAKVAPARSRDSSNTIESKEFVGGHLGIVGANAPSGLRMRARRVVLFDEVDGYPPSAGQEGDPVELARKRQSTFWNRLEVTGSTPTLADLSRIEEAVRECHELRRYHVPCPHCGEMQPLEWGGKDSPHGLKWTRDERGAAVGVAYLCRACAALIDERHRSRMLTGGRWVADVVEGQDPHPRPSRIAFHIPGLISPWLSWERLAQEWLDAQGHPGKLQVFVNTRLGEVWSSQGSGVEEGPLHARREVYAAEPVPAGCVLVTAGVDVQADRLEAEFVGWGVGDESWSLDYVRIPGDPTTPALWQLLDENVVRRTFLHPSGIRLRVQATAIDSGFMTQQVYRFVKDRLALNCWAVKGIDGSGRPIIGRPSLRNKLKVPLYPVGTDAAKSVLYGRLAIMEPGPGFCHFPHREPYDEEYFRQLTSERVVLTQSRNGYTKRAWVRRFGRRAEALDVRVYATAAVEGLAAGGMRLEAHAAALAPAPAESEQPVEVGVADGGDWATGGGRWGAWT